MKNIFLFLAIPLFSFSQDYSYSIPDNNNLIPDFVESLAQGEDDIKVLLELYQKKNISKDSLYYFIDVLDSNYFVNNPKEPLVILKFRNIFFLDQYYPHKYDYGECESFNEVKKIDEALQLEFVELTKLDNFEKLFWNGWVNGTFPLLLRHSRSLKTSFFKDNFHVYMSFLDNDFTVMNVPKGAIDYYLKASRQKQYFQTTDGEVSIDGVHTLLPRISEAELLEVFEELQITNPVYK